MMNDGHCKLLSGSLWAYPCDAAGVWFCGRLVLIIGFGRREADACSMAIPLRRWRAAPAFFGVPFSGFLW